MGDMENIVMQELQIQSLSQEDPLEEGMTAHSSILAWRIPGMGKPGGLPSMGLHPEQRAPGKGSVPRPGSPVPFCKEAWLLGPKGRRERS